MSFEEKTTWLSAVVGLVVPVVYFAVVLGQLGEVPAADIVYQPPLIIALVATVVLMILGSIGTAIGTAIGAEVTGRDAVDDIDRTDERDVTIGRRGDIAGYYVLSFGALGVLALTMLETEYFWIANALYLTFAVAMLFSAVVKLVAYRRGF